MDILTIGQKIRNRRKELNMTLKDLAGERVTAGQLSFVELGKSNPSPELLQYIAQKLGVTTEYLLESESAQAYRICEYSLKLSEAYIYDNKSTEACLILDNTAKIAQQYEIDNLMGQIELNRGKIAFKTNDYEKAVEYFIKANMYFLKSDDFIGAISSYVMLGKASCNKGFHNLAINYYKQAEDIIKEKDIIDDELISSIYFSICMCCTKLGSIEEAGKYMSLVEKYLECMGNKKAYAHSLMTLSLKYRDSGNYDRALNYANRALEIFKEIEDSESVSMMQMNIGIIYSHKKETEKSNFYLRCCDKLKNSLNSEDRAFVLLKIALNFIEQTKYDDALEYIKESFNMAVQCKNIDYQIQCYKCIYNLYMSKKDYMECEKVLKNMLDLLKSTDRHQDLAKCYITMGEYYKFIGDKDIALEYFSKGYEEFENIGIKNSVGA